MPDGTDLPVTVIGGYLGSGKTTLVNHLLRHADGLRLAILVNEFGELPIDSDLIEAEGDDVISLAGGCVCCSYGNDLVMAMIDLLKMKPRPDHVLLEASGVALPGAIAGSVSLLAGYAVDGVVVLADAETVRARAADIYMGDTITRQIGDADIVILNKSDLVQAEVLDATIEWLSDIAPGIQIVPTAHCAVPPDGILGSFLGRQRRDDQAGHTHSHHGEMFETASFRIDRPVDVEALARALAHEDAGLVRAKGFALGPEGRLHAIQVVGRRWSVTDARPGARPGIVAIGLKSDFDGKALTGLVETAMTKGRR
ncbi:MAG: GTP-binding protein [Alphaproteobacteria bacterium]|nr:GTP-binding protein [Alphaproteobacteria bacterium]